MNGGECQRQRLLKRLLTGLKTRYVVLNLGVREKTAWIQASGDRRNWRRTAPWALDERKRPTRSPCLNGSCIRSTILKCSEAVDIAGGLGTGLGQAFEVRGNLLHVGGGLRSSGRRT